MSYLRFSPLSLSASLINSSRRASLTGIPSCIFWDSLTRSLRKPRSGYGLAMRFTIASCAYFPSIKPTEDIYRLRQVAFGFSVILFWGDLKQSQGFDSGHWFWGTMLYLAVLLTVLGKAALVSECVRSFMRLFHHHSCICSIWTKYTVAGMTISRDCGPLNLINHVLLAIPGSFVFTMLFLPLYIVVAPSIGFSLEYRGLDPRLFTDSVFWFTILLVPSICLCRDFVWK